MKLVNKNLTISVKPEKNEKLCKESDWFRENCRPTIHDVSPISFCLVCMSPRDLGNYCNDFDDFWNINFLRQVAVHNVVFDEIDSLLR